MADYNQKQYFCSIAQVDPTDCQTRRLYGMRREMHLNGYCVAAVSSKIWFPSTETHNIIWQSISVAINYTVCELNHIWCVNNCKNWYKVV